MADQNAQNALMAAVGAALGGEDAAAYPVAPLDPLAGIEDVQREKAEDAEFFGCDTETRHGMD